MTRPACFRLGTIRRVQPLRAPVVTPTYNEAENILPLARDVLDQNGALGA